MSSCAAPRLTWCRLRCADNFAYCTVPGTGQDSLLLGAVALLIACVLQGKLSALWVLIAGAGLAQKSYGSPAWALRTLCVNRSLGPR